MTEGAEGAGRPPRSTDLLRKDGGSGGSVRRGRLRVRPGLLLRRLGGAPAARLARIDPEGDQVLVGEPELALELGDDAAAQILAPLLGLATEAGHLPETPFEILLIVAQTLELDDHAVETLGFSLEVRH